MQFPFSFDMFSVVSAIAYVVLWAISVGAAPRRDIVRTGLPNLLIVLVGTLAAYLASSIWIFVAGWILSASPFLGSTQSLRSSAKLGLIASSVSLAIGAFLVTAAGSENSHRAAFAAFILAAMLRKGVFPFHYWVTSAFETATLPAIGLLLNSHLGAFLMIRFAVPLLQDSASEALPVVAIFTLFTAVFAAVRALAERRPRRILALLCVSQASFILAGLGNPSVEGVTGALLHWWVVAFATTGMIAVYRALEARTTEVESPSGFLGFAVPAPRLAVYFAVCGLALVGLPGTLGFVAEDLLFHGSLASHPWLGIALPLATALNAITVLRLFATLFLGKRVTHATPIPDARPAERFALTASAVLLVAGGLAPSIVIALRSSAAESFARLLSGSL